MKKVVLSHKLFPPIIESLKKNFKVVISQGDLNKTLEENKDVFAIISLLSDVIDKESVKDLKELKIIANYAAGFNNIDIKEMKKRDILVTNTPDVLSDATADLTMALFLTLSRRIREGHKMVVDGDFKGWAPDLLLGNELKGKNFGIIGLGKIGQKTACRAQAFGLNILYYSKNRKKDLEEKYSYQYKDFKDLLTESDFISLHLPYNEDVHHLISKKEFDLMKESALFINTARGALVKEDDLAEALINENIAGAALDVYEFEPKINEKLLTLNNVVLAPHIGSATYDTRFSMAQMCIKALEDVLQNKKPDNIVTI